MKIGLGLYRHMLTRDYYNFARQAGCTHVVVHLVDYFNQGSSNPLNNQPTGSKYDPWGVAGDPNQLWTTKELMTLRAQIEDAGLILAAIENLDPAHWHDILLDGPQRSQQIEKVKNMIRRGYSDTGLQLQSGRRMRARNDSPGTRPRDHARNGWPSGRISHSERDDLEHGLRPPRACRHPTFHFA
jgi:hypothetical protein